MCLEAMTIQPFSMHDGSARVVELAEASGYQQAVCARIDLITQPDPIEDLAYLENRPYAEVSRRDRARYQKEDAARLQSYGVTWHMVGIIAMAQVSLVHGPQTFQRITLSSPGCWGVESDADPAHLHTIGMEEYRTLAVMLQQLHVFVPDDIILSWAPEFFPHEAAQ